MTYTTIDLFAGAGGLSLGFACAGSATAIFRPTFAVEHDSAAALTYKVNFDAHVHDGDIELFDPASYPEADVILGGPPCQGFSPLGRDRDETSRATLNGLWEHYLEAVIRVNPRAFVIENVPQFQRSPQFRELLRLMQSNRQLARYGLSFGVLNAADYGVPQMRRRGILVAVRDSEVPWPPPPSHGSQSPAETPHVTVREAIGDLPAAPTTDKPTTKIDGSQDLHIRRNPTPLSLTRYRCIPPGGNRFDLQRKRPDITPPCWLKKSTGTTDVMGRMWWDRPSPTIRTEFFKPEKGRYLHPELHRPITHREAARLQSFPDWFVFEGTKVEVARQIGNATPPGLGRALANFVASLLA
ncbi:MAG: DNA cytosine methyltransferase [bacterium]|nr:DNA cytosine methyltransferase [bacterium]